MLSCAAFLACVLVLAWSGAHAQIVAFGTSNVSGWNVAATAAFPAQLQDLLRAAGNSVSVVNAGVGGNTTADLLKRVDTDIPQGTKIVILDTIGGIFNDAKKGISRQQGDANMAAIEARLKGRGITINPVDVADLGSWSYYQSDQVHLTPEGHRLIASRLLPQVQAALGPLPPRLVQVPSATQAPSAQVRTACTADAKRLCADVLVDEVKRRKCMHDTAPSFRRIASTQSPRAGSNRI